MSKIIELIKERKFKYICFFWVIISIQFVIGGNLQTKGYSANSVLDLIINLLKIIGLSILFIVLYYCILEFLKKIKKNKKVESNSYEIKKYSVFIYFLIIFICWIPALLAFYPSILNYDGSIQIFQYKNNNMVHHTVISTLLMGFCYDIGLIIENTQVGMLIYSLLQMISMASMFAYAISFIEKKTNKKWIRNLSILFYAIFPFNQLFPLMTTKDTLFAGLVLVFCVNLYKLIENKNNIADYLFIVVLSVLMLLFRKNGIYAIYLLIPFSMIIYFKHKEILKKILIVLLVIIVSYKGVNKILATMDKNGGTGDGYGRGLYAQAIGRVCKLKKDELTEEEKQKINYYCDDYIKMGEKYRASLADKADSMMSSKKINLNKQEFNKFMIDLGSRFPETFIDSYLDTIRGYWYITDNSFNSIFSKDDSRGVLELTFSPIFESEKVNVHQNSLIPQLKEFYEDMLAKNYYLNIPILYVFFQPAIYLYILLACFLYCLYKNEKSNLVSSGFVLFYFITCFLAPCAIIRYMYPVITSIPVIVSIVGNELIESRKEETKK